MTMFPRVFLSDSIVILKYEDAYKPGFVVSLDALPPF